MTYLREIHPSPLRSYPIFYGALIFLMLIGFNQKLPFPLAKMSAAALVSWHLYCSTTTLVLNDDHLIYKRGVFSHKETTVDYLDIMDIDVEQNLVQRFLDTGTLKVANSGTGSFEIKIKNVPRPYLICDEIHQLKQHPAY
ncbi:PH domain-containing protein [Sphaerothrix gracilis]|uniref:PH domain-containing protein n=1 Tax=Sphaerothrix gracilis TaxID=3151835 RepID=UPI0031FC0885